MNKPKKSDGLPRRKLQTVKPPGDNGSYSRAARGPLTQKTRDIAERLVASGDQTPLEYMLEVMRTPPTPDMSAEEVIRVQMMRFEAAKAAAPYVHPKLAAVEHSGVGGGALVPPVLNVIIGNPEAAIQSPPVVELATEDDDD